MIQLPKDHMSVSQVKMYQNCPKQYEFRYIDGLVSPPGVALVEGSSHHATLEINNKQKVKTHEDLDVKEVVSNFCDAFATKCKEIESWDDSKDAVITRGKGLLEAYMDEHAPAIQPEAVEMEVHYPLAVGNQDIDVLAYIDLIQKGMLSDYKCVKRTKSQRDADDDLQLAVYSTALDCENVEFICLAKTKVPKVTRVPSVVTATRKKWAMQVMRSTIRAISAGVFPVCSPDNFLCCQRFCGYWRKCRGKNECKF